MGTSPHPSRLTPYEAVRKGMTAMKLSYALALPDCKAKKMQCFRGDLDAMCAQLKALGYVMASSCLRAIRTVQALLDTL